jgi:hypothetical protein
MPQDEITFRRFWGDSRYRLDSSAYSAPEQLAQPRRKAWESKCGHMRTGVVFSMDDPIAGPLIGAVRELVSLRHLGGNLMRTSVSGESCQQV